MEPGPARRRARRATARDRRYGTHQYRSLVILVLAAGGACSSAPAPVAATGPAAELPAGAVGASTVSSDCGKYGGRVKCLAYAGGAACFASSSKICDEPSCACFESDPCVANKLGTCVAYDRGIATCR